MRASAKTTWPRCASRSGTTSGPGDRLFGRELPQILLLHANEVGAAHWDRLFTWLEATGHRFVSADELLADPVFDEPHAFVGPRATGCGTALAASGGAEQAREEVAAHLDEQSAAWNRGDLESFCAGYEEDALFITPKARRRGATRSSSATARATPIARRWAR